MESPDLNPNSQPLETHVEHGVPAESTLEFADFEVLPPEGAGATTESSLEAGKMRRVALLAAEAKKAMRTSGIILDAEGKPQPSEFVTALTEWMAARQELADLSPEGGKTESRVVVSLSLGQLYLSLLADSSGSPAEVRYLAEQSLEAARDALLALHQDPSLATSPEAEDFAQAAEYIMMDIDDALEERKKLAHAEGKTSNAPETSAVNSERQDVAAEMNQLLGRWLGTEREKTALARETKDAKPLLEENSQDNAPLA